MTQQNFPTGKGGIFAITSNIHVLKKNIKFFCPKGIGIYQIPQFAFFPLDKKYFRDILTTVTFQYIFKLQGFL